MHGLLRIWGMQPIPLGDHKNIRNLQSFLQHGSGMPVLFKQCYNNSSPKTTVSMINFSSFLPLARKLQGLHATLKTFRSAYRVKTHLPTSLGHEGGKIRITTAFGRDLKRLVSGQPSSWVCSSLGAQGCSWATDMSSSCYLCLESSPASDRLPWGKLWGTWSEKDRISTAKLYSAWFSRVGRQESLYLALYGATFLQLPCSKFWGIATFICATQIMHLKCFGTDMNRNYSSL